MHAKFFSENLKGRNNIRELSVVERIVLKWI
jgi:hypothetical protein